jgi:hypothetical protein
MLYGTAVIAATPGDGRSAFTAGDGRSAFTAGPDAAAQFRICAWGDSRYGGFPVYNFDTASGNFRIWYVLDGQNAIEDQNDTNSNGVPDVIERIGADWEYTYKQSYDHKWFYHPDPNESRYLPVRDYYAGLGWPAENEDYGGDNRWDVYLGNIASGILGVSYAVGPFPESERVCYSAYFNMDNEYVEGETVKAVVDLWGIALTYMFDAAETSDTPRPRWMVTATGGWISENFVPQGAPGEAYFATLLRDTLTPLTEAGTPFVFFLEDWVDRYWEPPAWKVVNDDPVVKLFWRATSRGDGWYSAEPGTTRSSEEALSYLMEYYNQADAYIPDRGFPESFELFTVWNWFTGGRDDGFHYGSGSNYLELTPQNTWIDYPVTSYRPSETMNYLGAGYYRFDSPPAWEAAAFSFRADEANPAASKDWGGQILVSKDSTTWTDLTGEPGLASAIFTPQDKGIVRIPDPSHYESIVAVVSCTAYDGAELGFEYSFVEADDARPPNVSTALVRPQAYPCALEILLGGDEELFGAEAEVYFLDEREEAGTRVRLGLDGTPTAFTFTGTYTLAPGSRGDGTVSWRAADLAGNVSSGEKAFSAGYVSAAGGSVGGKDASLKLPAGAVADATLFVVAASGNEPAPTVAGPVNGGSPPTVVGPTYSFGPAWTRFSRPAEIALSYDGLNVTREGHLSVYRWNGTEWEDLGGVIDKRGRRVVATTDRLGAFAVGYGDAKVSAHPAGLPVAFTLYQNYPNPARGRTTVKYSLPAAAEVELALYDVSGRRVATPLRGPRNCGVYEVDFELVDESGRPLPAGVFLYRLRAGADAAVRKLVVTY